VRKFKGEIDISPEVRRAYSHDASVFEMLPEAVVYPKNVADIKHLVLFAGTHKTHYPSLALTPRGAGTDMSGGAIGNSIIVDFTRYMNTIDRLDDGLLTVEPGAYARDVDSLLSKNHRLLGCMPASKAWCTIGGMVANNAGGEQSLRYGNAEKTVKELRAVLADGQEYTFGPLTTRQLTRKISEDTFEGHIYKGIHDLLNEHYDFIRNAKPKVSKNSTGYNLWSVWDKDAGTFNLAPLLVGSQGTLGIVTSTTFTTAPKPKHTGMMVIYLDPKKPLGDIAAIITRHKPSTFEGFDDITFELGIRHFSLFKKQLGAKEWAKQQASLLHTVAKFQGHLPHIVLMVEFEGSSEQVIAGKINALQKDLALFKLKTEVTGTEQESSRFWQIRRASFQLLRQRVHGKYAAPFVDDLTVQPRYLPEFLPHLRKILRRYNLPATVAGHFGDGNLHIIPLIDIQDPKEQLKLEPVLREVIPLILKYGGTLAGEHGDGMIRGPWLPAIYGNEMYGYFRQVKELFDPMYIFNPHKKTDADWDFNMSHLRTTNKNLSSYSA